MRGTTGVSRLRHVIQDKVIPPALPAKAMQDWVDGGRITASMGLILDHFDAEYPQGEYKVGGLLKLALLKAQHAVVNVSVSSTTVADHGDHSHTVTADVPDFDNPFAPLAPGDRVIVLWLEDERKPVVIDRLDPD